MRFAATLRALFLGPGGWFRHTGFAFSIRFQFLGANCVGLMNRALRMDAFLRVGSRPANRTDFTARLGNPGSGLLLAHPATPPATRAPLPEASAHTQLATEKHFTENGDNARRPERPIRHGVRDGYRSGPGFRLVPRDGVSYLVNYATREATARRKELGAKIPHDSTSILRGKRGCVYARSSSIRRMPSSTPARRTRCNSRKRTWRP